MKITWIDIYKDFEIRFPNLSKEIHDWRPYDKYQIIVYMKDGRKLIYDYDLKSANFLNEKKSLFHSFDNSTVQPEYKGDIQNRDRDYSMKQMHDNGLTYAEIAKCFNISRQRAHKIVEQAKRNQFYGL